MPGLVGCVSEKSRDRGLLEAMVKPMLHKSSYQALKYTEKDFAVATIDLAGGRQGYRAKSLDGRYLLVLYGSIYEPWANHGVRLAEKLLERWDAGGWKMLADLNGEYIVVVWDSQDQRLTVVNDRLGLRRFNYWHDRQTFAFASEVKSLAVLPQVSRQIDEQALSELLIFGHPQDDRTLLCDVKLLPQASYLTWQQGELSIRPYWQFSHQADPALEDPLRAIDEYAYHVRKAVERRINGSERQGLFLSGGYDSRTLAGMMRKINPTGEISTYTTGHGHDHDSRYAKRIAQVIGSEHHAVKIPETFLQAFASDYAWILDGAVTADGCHRATLNDVVKGEEILFLNGFLGDVLSGGKPLDQMRAISDRDELIETGYRHYAHGFEDGLLRQLLRPQVYDRIRGLAREAFARSMQNARAEHPADRVVQAELVQRERMGNPRVQLDYLNASCYTVAPFADRDFVDFALRLPMSQRVGRRAYLRMMCREFPKLAQVPKSGDGLPLIHSKVRASIHWRWVLFKRNTLPKLTAGRWLPHNYAAFVHCDEWFRSGNREFIERALVDNPILEEQFQMEALNTLVRQYLDGTEHGRMYQGFASLIAFALFREKLNELSAYVGREQKICVA